MKKASVKISFIILFFFTLSLGLPYLWDFEWVGEPGYEWDGVEPDYFDVNNHFVYRIRITGRIKPQWVTLNLDWNGDRNFSRDEQIPMKLEKQDSNGFIYRAEITLEKSLFQNAMEYYFSGQIGYTVKTSPLMLGPFCGNKVSFAFIGDTLWDIMGPVAPLEIVMNSDKNTFFLVNTGDTPITFGLCVDASMDSPWKSVRFYKELDENKYILSAVFTDSHRKFASQKWFNSQDFDAVISEIQRFAHDEIFGFDGTSAGENVVPGDTTALWFNLIVPPSTLGAKSDNTYSIRVKIFALSAQ